MSIYKNGQKVLGSIVTIDDNHIKEVANTYSTNEMVIGKWIDGKPLYRKVINLNCPICTKDGVYADANTDVSSLNIDYIMFKNINVYESPNSIVPYDRLDLSTGNGGIVWYNVTNKNIIARHNRMDYNGDSIIAIIEYTKTTDV